MTSNQFKQILLLSTAIKTVIDPDYYERIRYFDMNVPGLKQRLITAK